MTTRNLHELLVEFHQGDDEGAGLLEYGLLVTLIAVVALAGVKVFGLNVSGLFNGISFG